MSQRDLNIEEALRRANDHWNAGQADQAELFCQRVLAVWPGQADALHMLGVIAHAYGNLDLGIQHLRQACLAPRAPAVYYSNLAEMCRQRGFLEEAEEKGRRATTLDPNLVPAWNNLGIILQEAGKLDESVTCLERVVALHPDNPEARNNLGNTYMRMGRLDRARAEYDRALALHPNYGEAHSNLAHLLHELGQFEQGAQEARLAIEISPQLVDAYINLAGIEITRRRPADALRWLDAVLHFAPGHPGALAAKAKVLSQAHRPDAALEVARRAVAAAPNNAEAHNALGRALADAGLVEDALSTLEKAAALPGLTESAVLDRATLLLEAGRGSEAKAIFDRVLEINPACAPAWGNRSDLKTYVPGDPDFDRMEALLAAPQTQKLQDRLALHFALGKAYLDIGDGANAFRHLDAGNRLKRSTIAFDGAATSIWMSEIAAVFGPALLDKFAGAGNASTLPIFVLGMPRSGTSLVEQVLASHPQAHGAGELAVVQGLVGTIADYPRALAQATPDTFARIGEAYLAQVAPLARGRSHVVDKMPANFLHAGLIHLALPGARIIHCRRDPVDTCLSCYSKLFNHEQSFAFDLAELGRFHRDYQALTDHWRRVLPANRFLDVDYEAVVDDLEGQTRRMLAFLGLPWDEACLTFHETKRVVRTASTTQVRQPVYKTSSGRWKPYAAHLAPLLDALGSGVA